MSSLRTFCLSNASLKFSHGLTLVSVNSYGLYLVLLCCPDKIPERNNVWNKRFGFLFVWFGFGFGFFFHSTHHSEEDMAEFTAAGVCGTGSSHHRGSGSRVTKEIWNLQSPLVTIIMQAPPLTTPQPSK